MTVAEFVLARVADDETGGGAARYRMAAECEAKRQIVALHGSDDATIRALAFVYAGHPDFDADWGS